MDSLCAMSFKNNAIRRARECFAFFVLPLWPSKIKKQQQWHGVTRRLGATELQHCRQSGEAMAASAPCICVCLDAAAGAGVIAASQARGQHGRVGVGQVQSQVPMSLQFSSSSSSAIRRGPARVRPGPGKPASRRQWDL